MPNTVLTRAKIFEEVQIALGSSCVNVELKEVDVCKCIADALRIYNRSKPGTGRTALSVTASQVKYGPFVQTGFQGITHVDFLNPRHEFGDPFDAYLLNDRTGLAVSGDTYGELALRFGYLEQARRVASAEPEWFGQWEIDAGVQEYYLYISVVRTPVDVSARYTFHYANDNNAANGMQYIPDGDTDWIIDYTTACAKRIVGRIRGKYRGVLNAQDGVNDIDADQLLEESREEMRELKDEILKRRRPLFPVIE